MKRRILFYGILLAYTALLGALFYFTFLRSELLTSGNFKKGVVANGVAQSSSSVCADKTAVEFYYYSHTYPNWEPNNKFGMYIYAENESYFELAQNLVNSGDGDWGYVLIPYNVDDKDYAKWDRVFTQLREKHLIPIIQLWEVDPDNYQKQTKAAAKFLNTFLWPIKYRYVSVYNEPNDQSFWYGRVDPEEYAKILDYTIDSFKSENSDFFMMNGAFNTSAPTSNDHMDAFDFMSRMDESVPGIFSKLDGWASHSYPQPNFSGSPNDTGRWSIRAYEEELAFLNNRLNVDKNLPVFITETGWAHAEGENYNSSYLTVEQIADYYVQAFQEVWLEDSRVRAVTPFTIWYDPPFDHFSWVNRDRVPYLHYEKIKKLEKTKGAPPVIKSDQYVISGC